MIINDISNVTDVTEVTDPTETPLKRIREEAKGGLCFDAKTGRISHIEEKEMPACKTEAENNPRVLYYAARRWSNHPFSEGCSSAPNRIYFEVTNQCNLYCKTCYRNAGSALPKEMDTEGAKNLIKKLAAIGVHELRLTGGEPTVRADILELIDCAAHCGLYITMGTNGIWSKAMTNALTERPIGRFLVSLDGPGLVNDNIRGAGSFAMTMRTMKTLIDKNRNVRVNMLLTRSALKHLDEFAEICVNSGVLHLSMIVPRPAGRAASEALSSEIPTPSDMEDAALSIVPIKKRYGLSIEFQYNIYGDHVSGQGSDPVVQKILSCPAGREAAFISPEGLLYACGCTPDWAGNPSRKNTFVAGNVTDMSAYDLWRTWQTSATWGVFRALHKSKDKSCFACRYYGAGCFGSCPIHAYIEENKFNGSDPMCWVGKNN